MFESRTPFPNWCEQHNPPSSKTQGVSEEIELQRTEGNSRMALSRWFPVSAEWHWRAAHMWSIDSCKVQLPIAFQSRSHWSYRRSSTGYAGPQVAAGQVHPTETLSGSPHLYTAHTPGAICCTSSPKNEKLQCSRHSDHYVYNGSLETQFIWLLTWRGIETKPFAKSLGTQVKVRTLKVCCSTRSTKEPSRGNKPNSRDESLGR